MFYQYLIEYCCFVYRCNSCIRHKNWKYYFKGNVSRDFRPPVFWDSPPPSSWPCSPPILPPSLGIPRYMTGIRTGPPPLLSRCIRLPKVYGIRPVGRCPPVHWQSISYYPRVGGWDFIRRLSPVDCCLPPSVYTIFLLPPTTAQGVGTEESPRLCCGSRPTIFDRQAAQIPNQLAAIPLWLARMPCLWGLNKASLVHPAFSYKVFRSQDDGTENCDYHSLTIFP